MFKFLKTILLLMLIGLFLTNCACAKSEEDVGYKSELDGKVQVTIVKDNSFFYPTITGNVVISAVPDSLSVVIENEIIPVDVVSQSVSNNGLYVLQFRKVHSFVSLKPKTYNVDLRFSIGGKTFIVEKFSTFNISEEYTGLTGDIMDLEKNWSDFD